MLYWILVSIGILALLAALLVALGFLYGLFQKAREILTALSGDGPLSVEAVNHLCLESATLRSICWAIGLVGLCIAQWDCLLGHAIGYAVLIAGLSAGAVLMWICRRRLARSRASGGSG